MKRFIFTGFIILILINSGVNAQWIQTSGANGSTITDFGVNGEGIFAAFNARYDSVGVILSTDFGNSWANVSTGLAARQIDVLFANGSDLFAAENDAGIYRTTNYGASWAITGLTVEYISGFAAIGTNLFASSKYNGVYLSTDNGTSWNFVNSGLTNTMTRSIFTDGSNLFVGTYGGGGIFLSTNNGTSWTVINSGLTQKYIYSFAKIGSNIFAGSWSAGIFRSTNNGTDWTTCNNGIPGTNPILAFAASGTNLFAGTSGDGVYLSTNYGDNWSEVNDGLTSLSLNALAVYGSYLYAGGDVSGVWRRPLSEMITGIEDEQNRLPGSFSLLQNYPNPFNPTTNIQFTLKNSQFVRLTVYDVLGNKITTLVNEEKPAGSYNVEFTIKNVQLSSGVYYYQLKAGDYSETKKMLLLR
jgi:Secretion system C-terminal sorting domain